MNNMTTLKIILLLIVLMTIFINIARASTSTIGIKKLSNFLNILLLLPIKSTLLTSLMQLKEHVLEQDAIGVSS